MASVPYITYEDIQAAYNPPFERNISFMDEVERPTREMNARANGKLIEMRGDLYKLSQAMCTPDGRCFLTSWKKRFFVLFEGECRLPYWKTANSFLKGDKPKGEIDLKERHVTKQCKSVYGKEGAFALNHWKLGDRFFVPEKKETLDEWVASLEHQFAKLKGMVTANDFEIHALLGTGGYGKVYLTRMKENGKLFAMKVIKKSRLVETNTIENTLNERNVMMGLSHPLLVNLHFAFQSSSRIFFVMDFVQGGELFSLMQVIRMLPLNRAQFYAAQIASALGYLHHLSIIYRDLKPENVLLDKTGYIKLADFGLSKKLDEVGGIDEKTFSVVGSAYYMAPEVLLRTGHAATCDWWSLGILIFEMATGLPPFYNQNSHQAARDLATKDIELPQYLPADLRDILSQLLRRDPNVRLGCGGFDQVKSHPWWQWIDWSKIHNTNVPIPQEWVPELSGDMDTRYFKNVVVDPAHMKVTKNTIDIKQQAAFDDFDYISEHALSIFSPKNSKKTLS